MHGPPNPMLMWIRSRASGAKRIVCAHRAYEHVLHVLLEDPECRVQVVDGRVGQDRRHRQIGRHHAGTARALEQNGAPDLPALDHALDGDVRRVKAPHKADRDQAPANRHFLLDDLPGHGGGGRQRLLAQHRLAGLETGGRHLGVRRVGRSDHDSINARVGDQLPWICKDACAAHGFGCCGGPLGVQIIDRGDPCPYHMLLQVDGMPRPHATCANDTNCKI